MPPPPCSQTDDWKPCYSEDVSTVVFGSSTVAYSTYGCVLLAAEICPN